MDISEQEPAKRRARQLRSNEDKRRIVEEATTRGASVAAVARKHGVNANLVFGWIRLHKGGLLDRCREPASLLPVKVAMPTLLPDRASREVEVAKPQAAPRSGPAPGHIEIRLSDAITLRVHGRVDRESLAAVVAALRAR